MPSTTGVSAEIHAVRTGSGAQPVIVQRPEKSALAVLSGTPVLLTGGYVVECGADPRSVLGFTKVAGSSLTADGVGKTLTFGSVPYQSAASNIPRGAPFSDGRIPVEAALEDTVFWGQVGTSTAVTDVGKEYGITKDTDGHWYIDKTKTTVISAFPTNGNVVVMIDRLDTIDTARGVFFRVIAGVRQLTGGVT